MTQFAKLTCAGFLLSGVMAVAGCNPSAEMNIADGSTANFGIYLVDKSTESAAAMAQAKDKGPTPLGTTYFPGRKGDGLIVLSDTQLTEKCLTEAASDVHPHTDNPIITFKFNAACSRLLGEFTAANVGRKFAVVLNNQVVASPTIHSAILSGSGFIEGDFTAQQAQNISARLSRAAKKN